MRLSKQAREDARKRCEAATDGPWTLDVEENSPGEGTSIAIRQINRLMHDVEWADPEDWEQNLANSEFIADARTDLPAALDDLDEQEQRIAALEAERDEARAVAYSSRIEGDLVDAYESMKARAEQAERELAALEAAAQDVAKFNWGTSVTEEYHFQRIDAMARLRSVLRGLSDQTS